MTSKFQSLGLRSLFFLAFITACCSPSKAIQVPAETNSDQSISYTRDIKPIFADNCFGCHQPARTRGAYDMTEFLKLVEGGDSGDPAIVPGNPDESYLVELITPDAGEASMPQKADPLSVEQIDLIRKWIAAGAPNDSPQTKPNFTQKNPPIYSRLPIITSLDYSPDGKLLAVSGFHEVLLLDVSDIKANTNETTTHEIESTGKIVHRLIGLSPRIASLKFSPNGAYLAVSGGSPGEMGEVQIWDVHSGQLKLSKVVSYDTVSGVSWSPDGSKVAFGCTDTTLRAIDAESGEQVLFQGAHDDWIRDTVFSVDGSQLVSVGRDMSCKLVEVETQRFIDNITSITPGVLKGGINSVARHPSRDEVVIGGADGIPKVYRMNRLTKRVIGDDANLIRRMPQMPGRIQSVAVSKNGSRIAAGSSLDGAGHVQFFSYEFDPSLPDDIRAIMVKVGRSAEERKKVEEYVTRDVKLISKTKIDTGIYTVVFHPEGGIAAAAGSDGLIRLIDVSSGKVLNQISPVQTKNEALVNARSTYDRFQFAAKDDSASNPTQTADLTGPIASMSVWPESVKFNNPSDYAQVVVRANLADGSQCDITPWVKINADPSIVSVSGSLIQAVGNGETSIQLQYEGFNQTIPVLVNLPDQWKPDFVQDVNPILTKVGCNAGTCHGSQDGKKGFKLSLRGYDPIYDIRSFTDDMASRRTNVASPDNSLMLMKPSAAVAHEGGKLLDRDSKYYQIIREWIADGAELDLTTAKVESIELFPKNPVLARAEMTQQLRVVASYSDGSVRDVTQEAVIETGNLEIAAISGSSVRALRRGEAPLLARYEGAFTATTMTCMGSRKDFVWKEPETWSKIDEFVVRKWERMKILPSELCTDEEFIRRIYLDLTGLPPSAEAVNAFLADQRETQLKRDELIDSLIGNDAFIEHWSNKWADLLQVNRKYLGVEGAQSFRNWIRSEVSNNTPYDEFARKILTATGSNRENPPAAYYKIHRTPEDTMENTTHLFLATRFNCNKCHDHPFERWTQDQYYETAAYFAQVQIKPDPASGDKKIGGTAVEGAKPLYEIISDASTGDVKHDRTGQVTPPEFPFECDHELPDDSTRREQLAAWITSSDNPYFATSYVNRLWGYMLGVGLVEPLDDIRAGNPATNPQLLEYLRKEFVVSGFDMRHVLRAICKSRVYQLSIKTNAYNEDDRLNYSHALARRLPAEVLFDSIHFVTGSKLEIPGVPAGTRAAALPDAGVRLPSGFLSTLGRPARESACECERSSDLQLGSVLALVSGPDVARAINDPKSQIAGLVGEIKDDRKLIDAVFMHVLNRSATETEIDLALESFGTIASDHQQLEEKRDERKKIAIGLRPQLEKNRQLAVEMTSKELDELIASIAPDLLSKEAERKKQIDAAKNQLAEYQSKADGVEEWAQLQIRQVQWHPLQISQFVSEASKPFRIRSDQAVLITPEEGADLYTVTAQTDLSGITAFRLELLSDPSLPLKGPGLAPNANLVLNEVEMEIAHPDRPKQWQKVDVLSVVANVEQGGFPVAKSINQNLQPGDGWAINGTAGKTSWATYQLKLPVGYAKGSLVRFKLHQRFDNRHQIGCFRISLTRYESPIGLGLSGHLTNLLVQPPETQPANLKEEVQKAFERSDEKLASLKSKLAIARKPIPVDAKIVELRQKLKRVSRPVPEDPELVQLNADVKQSEMQMSNQRLTATQDLVWALINSPSFLFNR